MPKEASIQCPNCGEQIDVNEILYHQLENEFKQKNLADKKKFEDEIAQKRVEYKQALYLLKEKEDDIKEQKEKFDDELARATKELEEKSNQVKELNKSKAEIEKLKSEKEEVESKVKADAE